MSSMSDLVGFALKKRYSSNYVAILSTQKKRFL